ncbi:MAG: FAD-dependent oxidoreductase [Chloroflexota bacterium]
MSTFLIIGGGIIGTTTAYYLAKAGADVTLVEKGEIAAGSSYGNAGLICPCHSHPIPAPGVLTQGLKWLLDPESPFYIKPRLSPELAQWLWQFQRFCTIEASHRAIPLLRDMQRNSLKLYEEIIAEEAIECAFEKKGGLTLFRTEKGLENGRHEVEGMNGFGLDMELLPNTTAVRNIEPNIDPSVIGGIHYREDAHINPAQFVFGLGQKLQAAGVKLMTQTEVLGFDGDSRRITAVRTTKGKLTPKQIILASGAWSTQLAHQAGVRILMEPAKGYSITIKRPTNYLHTHLHLFESSMAVTPMGDTIRFAGTLELAGFDFSINQRRVNAIRRGAHSYLQGLEGQEIVEIWGGMRPCAPDGLPYIGRTYKYNNLIIATGHAMLGMAMGPVTGKLVSQIACGEQPLLNIAAFAADRFG